jgi:mannose-1-phosphate guanylyltransferase
LIGWPLRLAARSTRRIVVNTWHLSHRMESALRGLDPPSSALAVSREDELMGTAGGLALARDRGLLDSDGPVLVLNGDMVLELELEPLFARHAASNDLVTMALLPHPDPARWSRVLVDPKGRVTAIRPPGKPEANEVPLLYPGVMLVSRAALDGVPSGPSGSSESLWDPALEQHRLGGVVVSGSWREVGTPADYLTAVLQQLQGGRQVHATAIVDSSAVLSSVLLGAGCEIGGDVVVDDSVIAEGAMVGRGARIKGSVLMGAVEVAPDAVVVDEFRGAPLDPDA